MVGFPLWRSSFFCELWAVEILDLVKAVQASGIGGLDAQFRCRLFRLVQALIFGVRVGFWEPFFFFALCVLCLVELAGFVTCDVGADHCRLRHIGWERCGRDLTSRPPGDCFGGFFFH